MCSIIVYAASALDEHNVHCDSIYFEGSSVQMITFTEHEIRKIIAEYIGKTDRIEKGYKFF